MKKVLTEPDERLRRVSQRVTKVTPEIRKLAKEMIDIMRNSERPGVGLAAPQIGILLRVITIAMGEKNIVLINPKIEGTNESSVVQEGCLSVPGIYANVTRPKLISYTYTNLRGKKMMGRDGGMFARILQHEIDHLDGKLFIDYLTPETEIELEGDAEVPKSLIERLKKENKK